MAKLKIGTIESDKPVRMTIELPAAVHRNLVAYAHYLNSQHVAVAFYEEGELWQN